MSFGSRFAMPHHSKTKARGFRLELFIPVTCDPQPVTVIYFESVPMIENIGKNMPATITPTMPPRNTIMIGSSAAVS
jgi:hypothetical protein